MSEYWKSQPRKFCDFCKCWITDNKPSIDFHEKGKRHKEAVKQKIEDLKKKGVADEKKRQKENDYMQRMEKAALEAFKRDLEENPELAAQYKVKQPEVFEGPQLPEGYVPPKSVDKDGDKEGTSEGTEKQEEWYEAMSEMGYPYYWNTVTGESIWVAPEKYVSLADQGLEPAPTYEEPDVEKQQEPPEPKTVEEIPLPPGIESIPLPGEADPPSPPSPEESESEEEDTVEGNQDRSSRGVFGVWSRVQKEAEQEQVDLQLPQTDAYTDTISIPVPVEEKIKFKEKKVTSIGSNKGGPVAFKKRKLASGARNVRRRGDDDDD